jgi:hypothetical protein
MSANDNSGAAINTRDHNDETALSQIGGAAILLWPTIPDVVRQEMLLLAEKIGGVRTVRDCAERLARLIESHNPDRVAPDTLPPRKATSMI